MESPGFGMRRHVVRNGHMSNVGALDYKLSRGHVTKATALRGSLNCLLSSFVIFVCLRLCVIAHIHLCI